jgi:prepilin-type N-terminal cleavage/methylation domain-containing protein
MLKRIFQNNMRKAFTLVELLVVISIIALLLSILIPALSRVRSQARAAVCSSNLKQLGTAMELYTINNDDKVMSLRLTPGEHWTHEIAPFFSAGNYKSNATKKAVGELNDDLGAMKVILCPSAKKPKDEDFESEEWLVKVGNARNAWMFSGQISGYGLNAWVQPDKGVYESFYKYTPSNTFHKYSRVKNNAPIFADAAWESGTPYYRDPVPPHKEGPASQSDINSNQMWRFYMARHGDAINVVFRDTHVEKIPLEGLWDIEWHRDFKKTRSGR